MNYVIAVFDTVVTAAVFYAGMKYGARGYAAVERELQRIEADYTYAWSDVTSASQSLHNEVHKITARIRKFLL
jgi:hypothetical protein